MLVGREEPGVFAAEIEGALQKGRMAAKSSVCRARVQAS